MAKAQFLIFYLKDPDKTLYLREIAKILEKEPRSIKTSLDALVKEGILKDERKANLRYFKLNKDHPVYEEIKKIISKTMGIENHLKKMIDSIPGVDYAFIFGSIVKNKEYSESDIDLMIIGTEIDQDNLIIKVTKVEEELKREINFHIYNKNEVIKQLKNDNDFLVRIFHEDKIILKGDLNEIARFS